MYNITIQQIEIFLAIAKHKNLSNVAKTMYISQPALSKTLQRFEEGIGVRLFTRGNQGVILTPEGEYLYLMLEPLYENLNKIIRTASSLSTESNRALNLLIPSTYDQSENYNSLAHYIQKFEDLYPGIALTESLCEFRELRQAVEFCDADIVIANDLIIHGIRNISYKRISEFNRYIAMSINHPLAKEKELDYEKLSDETFYRVSYLEESVNKEIYLEECRKLGFLPKKIEFVPNVSTQIHQVKKMRGMSICGKYSFSGKEDEIRYFPLPEKMEKAYVIATWHTNQISSEAQLFVNMIPGEIFEL